MLEKILSRLELSMKPYKPRMQKRRLKTDPEHTTMRLAYKRRNSSDKNKATKENKLYYKRNKNQLLMRNKRSRAIHKTNKTATASLILSSVNKRLQQAYENS